MATHEKNPHFQQVNLSFHPTVEAYRPQQTLRTPWRSIEVLLPEWPLARGTLEMYLPRKMHYRYVAGSPGHLEIDHNWAAEIIKLAPVEVREKLADQLAQAIQHINEEVRDFPVQDIVTASLESNMMLAQVDMRLEELSYFCRRRNFPTLIDMIEHQLGIACFPVAHMLSHTAQMKNLERR